jgi:hypothetical protein
MDARAPGGIGPAPSAVTGVVAGVVAACDVGQVAGAPCPVCDAPLMQEHAHTRCRSCGWLGKCCE